jgi:hypothetical protein
MGIRKVPLIVSKRNQFTPADELVEDALIRMPDQFKHPDFKSWLLRYTETVIKSVASHFGIAAQRGIEQAADLLCDPEFYETRRQRRAKYLQEMREQKAKQEWERAELGNCPTEDQIKQQISWIQGQIKYHEQSAANYTQKLDEWKRKSPHVVHVAPQVVQ